MALQRAPSDRFEAASVPLKHIHDFVVFRLLRTRIDRDTSLIAQSLKKTRSKGNPQTSKNPLLQKKHKSASLDSKPSDKRRAGKAYAVVIRLYDGILQSYEQLRELPLVESDQELSGQVETRILYVRALR